MEAISYAKESRIDVVLVDTAGRMQDNEPLMRALAKVYIIALFLLMCFKIVNFAMCCYNYSKYGAEIRGFFNSALKIL